MQQLGFARQTSVSLLAGLGFLEGVAFGSGPSLLLCKKSKSVPQYRAKSSLLGANFGVLDGSDRCSLALMTRTHPGPVQIDCIREHRGAPARKGSCRQFHPGLWSREGSSLRTQELPGGGLGPYPRLVPEQPTVNE